MTWESCSAFNTTPDAVRDDYQIGLRLGNDRLQLVGMKFVLKAEHDSQVMAALLQHGKQTLSPYAAEAVTPRTHGATRETDVDVIPAVEGRGDFGTACRISLTEVGDGLVGEHHAPAERIVGTIALDDRDLCVRITPLHEQRGVQSARSTTYHHHVHRIRSVKGYSSTVRRITSNIK